MIKAAVFAALLIIAGSACEALADGPAGVSDPARAKYNWVIHCQGCHEAKGSSSGGGTPTVAGNVARFLHVEGGRDYLARVPGVAFVSLPDAEVAELLNWMLNAYDARNVPADFKPYAAEEIGKLRKQPLISASTETRRLLLEKVAALEASAAKPAARTKDE